MCLSSRYKEDADQWRDSIRSWAERKREKVRRRLRHRWQQREIRGWRLLEPAACEKREGGRRHRRERLLCFSVVAAGAPISTSRRASRYPCKLHPAPFSVRFSPAASPYGTCEQVIATRASLSLYIYIYAPSFMHLLKHGLANRNDRQYSGRLCI